MPPASLMRWRTLSTIAGVISVPSGCSGGPICRTLRLSSNDISQYRAPRQHGNGIFSQGTDAGKSDGAGADFSYQSLGFHRPHTTVFIGPYSVIKGASFY